MSRKRGAVLLPMLAVVAALAAAGLSASSGGAKTERPPSAGKLARDGKIAFAHGGRIYVVNRMGRADRLERRLWGERGTKDGCQIRSAPRSDAAGEASERLG